MRHQASCRPWVIICMPIQCIVSHADIDGIFTLLALAQAAAKFCWNTRPMHMHKNSTAVVPMC